MMKRLKGGWSGGMRRAATTAALGGAALLLSVPAVHAKGVFLSEIPNAPDSCMTCHISTFPASWNDFGLDVKANLAAAVPDWASVCSLDSDGDGFTNGEELGDPDCLWTTGDPAPPGATTLPGDDSSKPAGVADPGPVEPSPEQEQDSQPAEPGPEPMPEVIPDTPNPDTGVADTSSPDASGTDTTTTAPPLDDGCSAADSGASVPLASAVLALFGWGILNRRRREASYQPNKGPALRG